VAAALLFVSGLAHADRSIIRQYGDHPSYLFEAEPHAIAGYGVPFNDANAMFGVGFRGTFHIADGFVPSINDSVGVGVGVDFAPDQNRVLVPVVMQWNFWLSTHWSVFGEPGLAIVSGPTPQTVVPCFYVGGRYHFTPRIALTMRLGYPDLSVGVSFLL
jgi:hypothetical protein